MRTAFYINNVDTSSLIELIGIGEVLAKRIIRAKNLSSREDIIAIQGIGSISLDAIEELNHIEIQYSYGEEVLLLSDFLEVPMQIRNDASGGGFWHASRGDRLHKGVDVICASGQPVLSPINGKVTKYGYSKSGNNVLRYVEVTGGGGDSRFIVRLHYCAVVSTLLINMEVLRGQHLGFGQDVSIEYQDPNMLDHIHFELRIDGVVSDPTPYLNLI